MLRSASGRLATVFRAQLIPSVSKNAPVVSRFMSSENHETEEAFNARYEAYFNRPDIDGWEIRKAMNELSGMDLVPEPKIVIAALKACRRINEYALCVRFLEVVKEKCVGDINTLYPYMLQEIRPTLTELGVETPEELGYDKPELAVEYPFV